MQRKEIRAAIMNFMRETSYAPMTSEELLEALCSTRTPDIFWQELLALENNGEIIKTRFDTYGVPEKMGLVAGKLQLTSKGFGFVIPDNKGDRPDVFIPPKALNGAMNNDRVLARVNSRISGQKPEGEILRIINHANSKVVGVFYQTGDFAFVTPDDKRIGQDIYIMRRHFHGARNMQKVVVEITQWPMEHRKAEGKIIEVLGNPGDVGLEILSIIKQNDLPLEFPQEVLAEAEKVPTVVNAGELEHRKDLRKRVIVTIDGADAKDLDDAVYVEQLNNKEFLLGVYIADVSYYVKENDALDREAYNRGTSVYLVDRVLPMLPPRLSNGICSLNQGEDRLAMACEMKINDRGELQSYEIFSAVINVTYRLTYDTVRDILDGDEEQCVKYADIVPMLRQMDRLRLILHDMRKRRGAVDFNVPEQKVVLDEKLKPVKIVQRIHGSAESLIEEFMLAANETVASHMTKMKLPFVYRVHDIPDEEKMKQLAKLLVNFNIKFTPGEDVKPKEIQKAVEEITGRPEERLVTTVALRSMKQAVYQTENLGHFGLAAKNYTHFTSPIRRYPDLIVHRLLRMSGENYAGKKQNKENLLEKLNVISEHSSLRERAAAEAERPTVELKKAEYMAEHVGEEFEGVISGVTAFGMFVELENGVEGLVHISSLIDDYYEYFEERYALVGSHSGKMYRLGDRVRIEVLHVSISEMSIDFIMAGEDDNVREHIKALLLSKKTVPKISAGASAHTEHSGKDKKSRRNKKADRGRVKTEKRRRRKH